PPTPPPFPYTTLFRSLGFVRGPHLDAFALRARSGHEPSRLVEIRREPPAARGGIRCVWTVRPVAGKVGREHLAGRLGCFGASRRSEEHTSELQSRFDL